MSKFVEFNHKHDVVCTPEEARYLSILYPLLNEAMDLVIDGFLKKIHESDKFVDHVKKSQNSCKKRGGYRL